MPINVNDPEYVNAEKKYYEATNPEDKLLALKKMISHAPKHKGGENLRQQLTTRRKKLEIQLEKKAKKGKGGTQIGIKKGDMQAILVGKTNSGKSTLLKILTNAKIKISENKFTTNKPTIGIMDYINTQIQLIEIPAIEGEYFDKSLAHTADTILIIITDLKDLQKIEEDLYMTTGKRIIIFNKSDKLNETEKRKIKATLESKKYNFEIISSIPGWKNNNLEELKKKISKSFNVIKIFTKEPGKEKSPKPVIMKPNSTVKDVAEKILKGLSKRVKSTKIWGPSSKFSGQKVGLSHKLKNMDTVELTTS